MAKTKISEFSATPGNNTDIDGINIAEGCAPSGINDAIRELMSQLKDFQAGTAGDSFNGPVGTTTAAAGAFTTLSSTGNTTLGDAAGDTVTVNGTATFANANPTLSAGTANGVAYLNGSKVLTTGSALVFDGTNLGIGTSSPASLLDVATSGAVTATIRSTSTSGTRDAKLRLNVPSTGGDDPAGTVEFTYGTGYTVAGSIQMTHTNNAMKFFTGTTERARIDSSGNLLINVTSGTSYKLAVKTSAASQSAIGTSGTSGDTTYQAILVTKYDNDSTTSQNFIQFQINNGGANCGKITANGANTAAFGSTSDQRVKENISDLPSQLDNIMALRPVEFDYVESYGGGHQIGFIAQEMQQVYPDVVSEDDTDEKIMSITGWSKTEARLVKAIQELNAKVEAQAAEIAALKSK